MQKEGSLRVLLRNAENLHNVSPWWASSAQDPYVVLALGHSRQRSRVCQDGGQHPTWNEQFIFEPVTLDSTLEIQILDRNTIRKDKLIGTCRVLINQSVTKGLVEVPVPVNTVRGEQRGILNLRMQLHLGGTLAATSVSFRQPEGTSAGSRSQPANSARDRQAGEATSSGRSPTTASTTTSNGRPILSSISTGRPITSTPSFVKAIQGPPVMRSSAANSSQQSGWVYAQTEDIHKEYDIGREIGKGNFGVTYLATCRRTGKEFACKMLSKRKMNTPEEVDDVKREIQILQHLKGHPNIVKIESVYEDRAYIYIVMEYCSGGELFDAIMKRTTYSEKDAADTIRTILSVVAHCHDNQVMHRDLKPENFMLSEPGHNAVLKAIDFGIGVFFEDDRQVFRDISGTAYYTAPEMLKRSYNKSVDVFACGVILYILLSGRPPFDARNREDIYKLILRGDYDMESEPWPRISSQAKDLVRRMLAADPSRRLTAQDALQHGWLKEGGAAESIALDDHVLTRMRKFAEGDAVKKAARMVLVQNLPLKEITALKDLFESIDKDKSGTITMNELAACLGKLGKGKRDLQQLMLQLDVNGDGSMDYKEFLAATVDLGILQREDNLIAAFEKFDADNSGFISREELEQLLKDPSLGLDNGEEVDTDDLLRQIDQDGDGRIDLQEFMLWMRSL